MKSRFYKVALLLLTAVLLTACHASSPSSAKNAGEMKVVTKHIYEEPSFSWTGGSGRVKLKCESVTVTDKGAEARVTFSSPNYEYVRIGETKYEGRYTDESSSFDIPVVLNEWTDIIGCTTAMSQPHEISYRILVSLDENAEESDVTTEDDDDAAKKLRQRVRDAVAAEEKREAPVLSDLKYEGRMELSWAKCFDVFYYEGGYKVLSVIDGSQYLIVPKGKSAPASLSEDMEVIEASCDQIYVAATAAMSFFDAIKKMENVSLTGTKEAGWEIDAPKRALRDGSLRYAGKYSEPDYELLISSHCNLAVESTMILHAPLVKEQLKRLHIPVLVDWSSYETDVRGRMEWVRAYGALMDCESEATAHFQKELSSIAKEDGYESTGKTVAYLSVNSGRLAVVPRSEDYIAKMIRMGGADYAFDNVASPTDGTALLRISMEECYKRAGEADVIIYNGNIEGNVQSIADFIGINPLFAEFRAVQKGEVYLCGKKLYQSSDRALEFVNDIHNVATGQMENLLFLEKLS